MSFARNVGAASHVNELRYISALMQTGAELRDNGTISTTDIRRLLKSRYNMNLTQAQAVKIVRGLGGGGGGGGSGSGDDGDFAQQGVFRIKKKEKRNRQSRTRGAGNVSLSSSSAQMKKSTIRDAAAADNDDDDDDHGDLVLEDTGEGQEEQQKDWEIAEMDEYLDLVQVLAVLLIPMLARCSCSSSRTGEEETTLADTNANVATTICTPTPFSPLSPQPSNLLQVFVNILLAEYVQHTNGHIDNDDDNVSPMVNNNSTSGIVIDEEFVTNLLLQVGELERAQDVSLIREMVMVATASSATATTTTTTVSRFLDAQAMYMALTGDVKEWKVSSEDDESTLIQDAYGDEDITKNPTIEDVEEEEENDDVDDIANGTTIEQGEVDKNEATSAESNNNNTAAAKSIDKNKKKASTVERVNLNHTIVDFAIDAHSSVVLTILIWIFYTVVSFSYIKLFQATVNPPCRVDSDNPEKEEFGCRLAYTLSSWIIVAFFLSISGIVIIIPLSLGNNPNIRTAKRLFVPLVVSIVYTVVPYYVVHWYAGTIQEPYDTPAEQEVTRRIWPFLLNIAFVVGWILVAFFLWQFVVQCLREICGVTGGITKLLVTSNLRGEGRLKRAATRKLNKLILAALELHQNPGGGDGPQAKLAAASTRSSSIGANGGDTTSTDASRQTMLNYVLHGQKMEQTGGLFWTFKRLLTGALTEEDGIWIPTRTLSFQTAQILVSAAISYLLFLLIVEAGRRADQAQAELDFTVLPQWAIDIVPTRKDVYVALFPALAVAMFVMLNLILLYIPSTTATVLQYRSGDMPSLGSPYFNKYRTGVDTVTNNLANALYGTFGSSMLFFILVGLVIFLFIWDFSKHLMIEIMAWGLGLVITIAIKMILTTTCRTQFYVAFYRKHPRYANISSLALETWQIGLGGSVLIGRITQFLAAAIFWVGRIDVPFLAPDVNMLGYRFDVVPDNFIKDIFVHESHRHPYIERISQMYLIKLKRGNKFVTRAGAAWRQVFVLVLMPWMSKHRVFYQERTIQAQAAFSKRKVELQEESKGVVDHFTDDMVNLTRNIAEVPSALVSI